MISHPQIALRPYQIHAFNAIKRRFDAGDRSTLLVLPTGTGKTLVFGTVAKSVIDDLDGRVLVLAHRGELLTQAANSLAGIGVEAAIEKAEMQARAMLWDDPMCVVASVQTMQRNRLRSWPRDHFKLIITDEAHHAPASSYQEIYNHFNTAWHLGVTATADRLDGENLGQVFQSLAFEYPLREAIESGYLSRLRVVRCETSVDLRDIRTTAGDLNQGDVEEAIRPHIEELVNATRQEIGSRRSIVFTPDVGSAEAFASGLNAVGISAASISGRSTDREEVLAGYRSGKYRVLANAQLLTEGFDAPFTSAIVLARPTKSRAAFSQMVGRGTRLCANKQDCIIVDFAWLTGKHKLVSPAELFDTTTASTETYEIAQKMIEKGETDDLLSAIQKAEKVQADRQKLRVQVAERQARYRRVSYNPLAVMDVLGMPLRTESDAAMKSKPSDKQIQFLEKLGMTDAKSMSKRRASMMIDTLKGRMDQNLATLKQVSWLITKGIDPSVARKMTKSEASERLDAFFNRQPVH